MKAIRKIIFCLIILSLIVSLASCATIPEASLDPLISDFQAESSETTTEPIDIPTTVYTEPTTEATQVPTTEATQVPTTEATQVPTTEATQAPHIHSFSAATCTAPKTCECGVTKGDPAGHSWKSATCTKPAICANCGATEGSAAGHAYVGGKCEACDQTDPSYSGGGMVWIPTKGGKKYHSRSGCSNMDNPEYVTKSEAISRGFDACKKCY